MLRILTVLAVSMLALSACKDSDANVNPDPTPDLTEKDSVVISQERYDKLKYSDTINVLIDKENGAGAIQSSVYDFGAAEHRSVVTFTSEKFTKGAVSVKILGKRTSLFEPALELRAYQFSTTATSITDTITGIIGSVSVASGSGTTCLIKGQIILLP